MVEPMSTDLPRKPRVAVVFGGRSSEHAVSCASAASVLRAIDRDAYDVVPIGIARDGRWVLAPDDPAALELAPGHIPEVDGSGPGVIVPLSTVDRELRTLDPGAVPEVLGEVDVVFPVLHGPWGEDGTIQGMLDLADVRYVGSGVLASAAGMDKHYMKVVFAGHGLPVGPYAVITDRAWRADPAAALDAASSMGFPVFVKPARAGSSMGITRVTGPEGLAAAIETAREHDPKVLVEAAIFGREIECAVLEGRGVQPPRTSQVGEIRVVKAADRVVGVGKGAQGVEQLSQVGMHPVQHFADGLGVPGDDLGPQPGIARRDPGDVPDPLSGQPERPLVEPPQLRRDETRGHLGKVRDRRHGVVVGSGVHDRDNRADGAGDLGDEPDSVRT